MNQHFGQIKIFESQNKIYVYIKQKSIGLIQQVYKYKIIQNSILHHLHQYDQTIDTFINENPDFIKHETQNKVIGNPYMVDKIAKQLQYIMNSDNNDLNYYPKYVLQQFKSIQVNKQKHQQFLQLCKQYRNIYPFQYRIDLKQIRITNYAKQCSKLYIVFRTYDQIINLQSIIHQQIQLTQIKYIIDQWDHSLLPNVRIIKSKNQRLTIILYPWNIKSAQQLFTQVKNSSQYLKVIVCPKYILQQFMPYKFDFNISFVVNQPIPYFPFIKTIKQIQYNIIKNPSLQRQLKLLRTIYRRNIIQYHNIGQYKISPIDSYNITDAIIHQRKDIQIFLTKQYKKQMIYLTYFSKLFQVFKNQNGQFIQFKQANLNKDLPKIHQSQIKTIIKKAFINGQTYVPFYLPYQRVKSLSIQQVTLLKSKYHNINTILAWNAKLYSEGSQLLKIHQYTYQYIETNFSKIYKIIFSDQQIMKKIKDFRMGYGYLQRFKNGKNIGIQLSAFICRQVLKKIQNSCIL